MAIELPSEYRTVAEGLRFPEGPTPLEDGSVLVVEIARGHPQPGAVRRHRRDGGRLGIRIDVLVLGSEFRRHDMPFTRRRFPGEAIRGWT
jgi:hypothetical protein